MFFFASIKSESKSKCEWTNQTKIKLFFLSFSITFHSLSFSVWFFSLLCLCLYVCYTIHNFFFTTFIWCVFFPFYNHSPFHINTIIHIFILSLVDFLCVVLRVVCRVLFYTLSVFFFFSSFVRTFGRSFVRSFIPCKFYFSLGIFNMEFT